MKDRKHAKLLLATGTSSWSQEVIQKPWDVILI